jgi:hypothetical protein
MSRTTKIVRINSHSELPTIESILKLSRDRTLKIIFEDSINDKRELIGEELKKLLDGFQIGIHITDPEINISKLITDEEIEAHQLFFEKCAKDYRKLSQELIFQLANKFKIEIDPNSPLDSFQPFANRIQFIGTINDWRYNLHGFHCGFENRKTGQVIEVPLVFGLEFGDLDPYFFTNFIISTPEYYPLPVAIYERYADGNKINNKMVSLGRFERINSIIENHFGIAVTDREKVEMKLYNPPKKDSQKFNIWKFLGLK